MKKVLLATLALGLVLGAMGLSRGPAPVGSDLQIDVQERNPWTNLKLNNDPDTFHFAITSDRTGGHRARVFSMAVDQLNLLQPSFVVSVGDLIEGYTKDKAKMAQEWKEFQGYINKLQMPFFYVPGNHDVSNLPQAEEWKERFGRAYYHFLYKNVLFLCANSSDPFEATGPMAAPQLSKEQLDYFDRALRENKDVRWTIVLVHKPVWIDSKVEKSGWLELEKMLQGRKYTVFAGHVHRYQKFVRHGMNYYMFATTGGSSKMRGLRYGEFDHIVWVTMKKDGPTMANIMLDGIYPEDLKRAFTDEDAYIRHGTKTPQPVRGKVLLDGAPVPDAQVAFHAADPDPKKKGLNRIADAVSETDGTFELSSYKAWDGAPAGEYTVTITRLDPLWDAGGKFGPNRLPAIYATTATTPLRATVKEGNNDFVFELTSK